MGYTPVVDEVAVASAAIGLLTRDVGLAATVWRDPVTDFARKKDETVSVYLPAYVVANRRTLRANENRVRTGLKERKVDVVLDTDLQVDVALTDENQTLDTRSIVTDVSAPSIGAIVRGYDEGVADVMQSTSTEVTVEWDENDGYGTLVDADLALTDNQVPATGRHLVVGTNRVRQLRKEDLLVQANTSGSAATLRNGDLGAVAGFESVMTSPFLDPDFAMAYHTTAFALCSRAPVVPQGVAWGNVQSSGGFAIRVMQHLTQDDDGDLLNMVFHDSWYGISVVTDDGEINENGVFIPAVDPDGEGQDALVVRAVALTSDSSS